MMGLTPGQAKVLAVIKRWLATGIAPSVKDISTESGINSNGAVHKYLRELEEREYIHRMPNRARAIELLDRGRDWNMARNPARPIAQVPLYTFQDLVSLAKAGLPLSALTWPVAA